MLELTPGKLNIIVDGQFGSTGKGLFSAYVGSTKAIDISISVAGPNAGHTFYQDNKKIVLKQLPVTAVINEDSFIYLPSGAIINVETLLKEVEANNIAPERLFIHKHATIITDKDIEAEKEGSAVKISSTQNGVGQALARKINRSAEVAKDITELKYFVKEFSLEALLDKGLTAFLEMPQGYSLSLNSGFFPYCTSREITVQGALNEVSIHPSYLGKVILTLRTFPIRVGNLPGGYSGPFYSDSVETNWKQLGLPVEYTTNTKRIRRVATFSKKQYKEVLMRIKPDYVFLNFCNYMSKPDLINLLVDLPEVTHLGFGPKTEDIYENNLI